MCSLDRSRRREPRRAPGRGVRSRRRSCEPVGTRRAAQRPQRRLGRAKAPVLVAYVLLVAAALGVPVGSAVYWMVGGVPDAFTGVSLVSAALHTAGYSAAAALLATVMATPVALLVTRRPGRLHLWLERSTFLVLAMPGLVVAWPWPTSPSATPDGFAYQTWPDARPRLRHHVLPARSRRRTSLGPAGAGRPRGGGQLPRSRPPADFLQSHAAAHCSWPRRGLLPRLPVGGHGAHRHVDPDPDRIADTRHPVLGVPEVPVLLARRHLSH